MSGQRLSHSSSFRRPRRRHKATNGTWMSAARRWLRRGTSITTVSGWRARRLASRIDCGGPCGFDSKAGWSARCRTAPTVGCAASMSGLVGGGERDAPARLLTSVSGFPTRQSRCRPAALASTSSLERAGGCRLASAAGQVSTSARAGFTSRTTGARVGSETLIFNRSG